jgi:hypothetical protein
MSRRIRKGLSVLGAAAAAFSVARGAGAQVGAGTGFSTSTGPMGWSSGPGVAPPSYGPSTSQPASDLEVGTLYGVSIGYGVGTGIWLDAELSIDDPGLRFLPPSILGLAAPVGVFFLNRPTMPRGMPAAISAGMAIGAGEGIGIASLQFVRAQADSEWGFRGFARSVFIGSTVGAGAGYVSAIAMEPSPRQSILIGSGVAWGTVIGSMFGYGGSAAHSDFGDANDVTSIAGFVGYNAGLLGAAGLSAVWVPTYRSLTWMWIGFGAGLGVSLPIYLFYAGGDHDPRRGLIFQGTAATLGLIAGSVFTIDSSEIGESEPSKPSTAAVQVTGGGLMPVPGGMGFTLSGVLF